MYITVESFEELSRQSVELFLLKCELPHSHLENFLLGCVARMNYTKLGRASETFKQLAS